MNGGGEDTSLFWPTGRIRWWKFHVLNKYFLCTNSVLMGPLPCYAGGGEAAVNNIPDILALPENAYLAGSDITIMQLN